MCAVALTPGWQVMDTRNKYFLDSIRSWQHWEQIWVRRRLKLSRISTSKVYVNTAQTGKHHEENTCPDSLAYTKDAACRLLIISVSGTRVSFIFISTWRFAEFLCVWINGNIFSLCIARRRGNLGQHSINFWGVWREIDLSNHSMIWANVRSDRKMYVSVRQGWGLCDPKRRLALWQKYLTLSSLSCGRPIVSSQPNIKYARQISQNLKCAVTRYPHKNISMCTFLHVDI